MIYLSLFSINFCWSHQKINYWEYYIPIDHFWEKNNYSNRFCLLDWKSIKAILKAKCFINPISTTWLRDTLYTCDGFSTTRHFPLLFNIGNGNVTIQSFIKQYFPILLKTDDGINTIQGFSFTWVLGNLPYITPFLHA